MAEPMDDLARQRGKHGVITIRIGSRIFTRAVPDALPGGTRTLPPGATHKQRNDALHERMAALRRRRWRLIERKPRA